jgi:hypothetical protein
MEVTLGATRPVRVPVAWGAIDPATRAISSSRILFAPFPDFPDLQLDLVSRRLTPQGQAGLVVEESLPEGTYRLDVRVAAPDFPANTVGLGKAGRELVVPRGEGPIDLPPLEFEPSDFLKMAGKPAPEIDATDLDTGRPVRLADFRGKVVVLHFWNYWISGDIRFLAELHRKFEGRPLAILALHDRSVRSRAEYDREVGVWRDRLWDGRDLPFRVLLDRPDPGLPADASPERTGTTIRRYGARLLSAFFVIDSDGTLVDQLWISERNRLTSLVAELLEKAEAR